MDKHLHFDEFEAAGRDQWREVAEAALKGGSVEDRLFSKTAEGIDLKPIYDQIDLDGLSLMESRPGFAPFIRGDRVAGDKIEHWWIAQDIYADDPVSFNERTMEELMQGRNAIVFPGDDVLAMSTVEELRVALKGIDLQIAPLLTWTGTSSLGMLERLDSALKKSSWRGAVLADPIGASLVGNPSITIEDSLNEMAQSVEWSSRCESDIRTIGVQGHLWGDAGTHSLDELAYTLATAVEYLKAMLAGGVSLTDLSRQFVFSLSLGSDVFMQIAKLRAARMLWSKAFSCFGGESAPLFIHGRSHRFNKSLLDPHSNILRATAEAFAGVMGGVNSMHISPYDEPAGGNDPGARRLARNTQLLLAEECGFTEVADAAGGSWYVEILTDQLARKAWQKFQEIEQAGGMLTLLRSGKPQNDVSKLALSRLTRMSQRRDQMVGVNLSPDLNERFEQSVPVNSPDEGCSTAGEIQKLLFPRAAEGYEQLRRDVSECWAKSGSRPAIKLAKFGAPKQWTARAEFSRGFFGVGGYEIQEDLGGAQSIDEALTSCLNSSASVVVLCATDEDYLEIVPNFVAQLKQNRPDAYVILAGNPSDQIEAYRQAGIDDFIHMRSDCLSFLNELNQHLGVTGK